jgi:anhydro-N-acetylmuramic acid kinase
VGKPKANPRLLVGAMSGTSADGVDAALVRITGRFPDLRVELLAKRHAAYPERVSHTIHGIRRNGQITLAMLEQLSTDIAASYARCVSPMLGRHADAVRAVGVHGQTLFHAPPLTTQVIDAAKLATMLGVPVVSDFRRADCALGGQGAPLVPIADYILFRSSRESRAMLNLGGIANITLIPAGGSPDVVVAFDTGPANCISDHLCKQMDPAGPGFDRGGVRALRGTPDERLVEATLSHRYFRRRPPKSTDGPEMIDAFMSARMNHAPDATLDDLLASAATICARAIARATGRASIIAAGGGVKNRAIVEAIRHEVGPVTSTASLGIPPDAREAIAFAILTDLRLAGLPGNLPGVTGASRPALLGSITEP